MAYGRREDSADMCKHILGITKGMIRNTERRSVDGMTETATAGEDFLWGGGSTEIIKIISLTTIYVISLDHYRVGLNL